MKKHLFYYISLISILVLGCMLAVYAPLGKQLQMAVIIVTAVLYVTWGVLHHVLHHSFSIKIMLEYIAIATLGISVALFFFTVAL